MNTSQFILELCQFALGCELVGPGSSTLQQTHHPAYLSAHHPTGRRQIFAAGQGRHGGTQSGAFIGDKPSQRPIEDAGENLAHQVAARNTAGDGNLRNLLARLFVGANSQRNKVSEGFERSPSPHTSSRPGLTEGSSSSQSRTSGAVGQAGD